MVKAIRLILSIFIIILFVNLASSLPTVDINVKQVFRPGDLVKFNYTLLSNESEEINYIASINCMGSPEPSLSLKVLNLTKDRIFSGEYAYGKVDKSMKSGNCLAYISLLEPYNLNFKENFEIINLLELSITPSICKTEGCTTQQKVFNKGEEIFLNYNSKIENIIIEANLIFPDSSIERVNFPYSFEANKSGDYKIEIIAIKEGYEDSNLFEEFAVIGGNATINYADIQNEKLIGEKGNFISNLNKYKFHILIAIILALIILKITLVLIKRLKPKENILAQK